MFKSLKSRLSASGALSVFIQRIKQAVPGKRKKLIKSPKFFLGITLAVLSLELYFGVICGYLGAKFLSGKEAGIQGKIKSLIIDIGKCKIHFHHWLYGLLILISIFLMPLPVPRFSFGLLGGLIFQGIVCYPDWHKIIIKKNNKYNK